MTSVIYSPSDCDKLLNTESTRKLDTHVLDDECPGLVFKLISMGVLEKRPEPVIKQQEDPFKANLVLIKQRQSLRRLLYTCLNNILLFFSSDDLVMCPEPAGHIFYQ